MVAKSTPRLSPQTETAEWQIIYSRRTAIERVFSRLKDHKRLNNITIRRLRKVTVHSLIPVIVTQVMALAFPDTPRNCVWGLDNRKVMN